MQTTSARFRLTRQSRRYQHAARASLTILLLGLLLSILSACGGDPQIQQQATTNHTALDNTIQQAQNIGVPQSLLKSILSQENTLNATSAPLSLFNDQPASQYYQNLASNYKTLNVQLEGVIQVATEEAQQTAETDVQNLHQALGNSQIKDISLDTFTQVYQQGNKDLTTAKYPKDFAAISTRVKDTQTALNKLPSTLTKLDSLKEMISVLKSSKQDTTDLQKQYNTDKEQAASSTTPSALSKVDQTIQQQNEQIAQKYNALIPQLSQSLVDNFDKQIQQLKTYNMDTTAYEQRLAADRSAQSSVKTFKQYLTFSTQVNKDLASMQTDLLKGQTAALIKAFHTEAISWGNAHQYHDTYNDTDYPLDTGYLTKGIGEDLDNAYAAATTVDDYQSVLTEVQNETYHLQLMEQNYSDSTAYDKEHTTDMQLMEHYNIQSGNVIVVSFLEEALRYYENGKLVRSFLITAGRPELPPVPGLWPVMWRLKDTTFKSSAPKGSEYWYADTHINYAIMYHSGGYFLHDSWWRNDYGPGTQFYHLDSSGNSSANYGSHGCINMPTSQAEWIYNNTDYNTQILMY